MICIILFENTCIYVNLFFTLQQQKKTISLHINKKNQYHEQRKSNHPES